MIVVGIDPGLDGAAALLIADRLHDVYDLPTYRTTTGKRRLCGEQLAAQLRYWHRRHIINHIWIEAVHAMPGQGGVSGFTFGTTYGICLGAAAAITRRRPHEVPPQVWKKAAGVTADKQTSLDLAVELWPDHAPRFARKKDVDRAEAALIARHGWLTIKEAP